MVMKDNEYLARAIELAKESIEDGEAPFGAVIVKDSRILAQTKNRTKAEQNPTLHAEMVAIRHVCLHHNPTELIGSTLYASCEPCFMCLAAIFYSGIKRVVYAGTLEDAIEYGSGDPYIKASWLNDKGKLELEIVKGDGQADIKAIYKAFVEKYGSM